MTSTHNPTRPTGRRRDAGWLVLALICACQFMVILDSAIVNVALPSIDRDLAFTPAGLAWVVNGYLLTFAGFLLVGGRAADLYGYRRLLVAGLSVFAASSLVGGLATGSGILVAARITQGIGAAMLAPATLVVINTCFTEPAARARAFGAWSAAGGVGGMAGALAGGVITTGLSWRWVFGINVPIGALLIFLATRSLNGASTDRRESIDLVGAITGTAGLAALVFAIMQTAGHGWTSAVVVAPMTAGLILIVLFVVLQVRLAERAEAPMMPTRLFGQRSVAVGSILLVLFGGIAIAMWYFTSLFLQNVLGYSALQAGLGQSPAAVIFLVVARCAAALLPRVGVRGLLLAGGGLLAIGFGWLSRAGIDDGFVAGMFGPTLVIAIGIGLTFPTLMAATTANVHDRDAGVVGGIASTAHQIGAALGLAALASLAATRTTTIGGGSPSAIATGYHSVFLVAAALGLAIALVGRLLPRRPAR